MNPGSNRQNPHAASTDDPFNLVTSDWIPVRMADGASRLVSLDAAFRNGRDIVDLDCAPHERIALTRLLVCITHAALGAPNSPADWGNFGQDMATAVPDYLHHPDILPHFNLLGDGPRFLQVAVKNTKQEHLLAFLEFKFASNPTLFDHAAGEEREMSHDQLALNLLTFQNFFIGGCMGPAKNGGVTGNGPALKFLHTYLRGANLRESILLNLLDKSCVSNFGRPVWEHFKPQPIALLPRLAPQPCNIWLTKTRMWISQGIEYPLETEGKPKKIVFRDPYATIVARQDSVRFLRANPDKALWRDLYLILELKAIEKYGEIAAPLNLISHASLLNCDHVSLWAGELIKGEKAVVVDAIESTFAVPTAMLKPEGLTVYQAGVDYAEKQGLQISHAVDEYIKSDSSTSDRGIKQLHASEKKSRTYKRRCIASAQRHYWHALDREYEVLLDLVGEGSSLRFEERGNQWGDLVRSAARKAYEHACPRQTSRQIQAFAAGLRKLSMPKSKPSQENA